MVCVCASKLSMLVYFFCLYSTKLAFKNLGFFKLASIGSYVNGVYCKISLPRFLIRLLIFVLKKLVLMGVAFKMNHSQYSIVVL